MICMYLYACLGEGEFLAELFTHERVWIMRFIKQSLEFIQLLHSEIRPTATLFQLLLQNAAAAIFRRHLTAASHVTFGAAILDAILDV